MFALEIHDAISILTGVVTFTGVFVALRFSVSKLETGLAETLRQIAALHKRLDAYGERITRGEIEQAVLEERVANIRGLQRVQPPIRTVPVGAEE